MKAISLFSGAGGDSIGLENAGLNVTAFSEFNRDAVISQREYFVFKIRPLRLNVSNNNVNMLLLSLIDVTHKKTKKAVLHENFYIYYLFYSIQYYV